MAARTEPGFTKVTHQETGAVADVPTLALAFYATAGWEEVKDAPQAPAGGQAADKPAAGQAADKHSKPSTKE